MPDLSLDLLDSLVSEAIPYGLQREVLESFTDHILKQIRANKNEPGPIDYSAAIADTRLEWDL